MNIRLVRIVRPFGSPGFGCRGFEERARRRYQRMLRDFAVTSRAANCVLNGLSCMKSDLSRDSDLS
ncbi:hypothetical protein [Rhizobium sp. RHZ01]|uniref:hypothetical protein n=1 Tax=Rhizobium sp. RHZ01 TaxID=2769304 RepID=UPI00177AF889|nr:hypothetical protein [Rhizobium sp. RHZ01]MBD9447330.1 hypothetical protein [Rhizobium sp. RHZ01]